MRIRILTTAAAVIFSAVSMMSADTKPAASATATLTIVGRLQKAVEAPCQLVKEDKTKKIYSFTPKSKYKNGTHVKITAHKVDLSVCQQGTPIAIDKIVKIK